MLKILTVFAAFCTLYQTANANELTAPGIDYAAVKGEWKGACIINAEVAQCSFYIFQEGGKWKASMDVPGNDAFDIPHDLSVSGNKIVFSRKASGGATITYAGTIHKNVINGTYTYQKNEQITTGVFQLMLNPSPVSKYQPLPAFELKLVDAQTVTNKNFSGKYLLVDFWSTTCKICVPKRPVLETAAEQYNGKPLQILSIALDSEEAVTLFRKERSPMPWSNAVLARKWEDEIVTRFGVDRLGLPTTLLVSPGGTIVATTDQLTKQTLLKTLEQYLDNAK